MGSAGSRSCTMDQGSNLVTTMLDEHERRALAELFREDDRLRAENEEYLARREPPAASPVSGDGPGLVDGTMLDAADETGTPSNGDGGFSPEQLETLAEIISEVQKDWDREHATEMAALRCEIEELRTRAFGPQSFA